MKGQWTNIKCVHGMQVLDQYRVVGGLRPLPWQQPQRKFPPENQNIVPWHSVQFHIWIQSSRPRYQKRKTQKVCQKQKLFQTFTFNQSSLRNANTCPTRGVQENLFLVEPQTFSEMFSIFSLKTFLSSRRPKDFVGRKQRFVFVTEEHAWSKLLKINRSLQRTSEVGRRYKNKRNQLQTSQKIPWTGNLK